MIVFDLACSCCGYTFEGWFHDRSDFENQQAAFYLVCPQCGGREIRKILSPIRIKSSNMAPDILLEKSATESVTPEDVGRAIETLQKFVEENFEDVGVDLAKESLKIHYGVSEPRNIRGVTTAAEEKKLQEEGISLLKIPMPVKSDKSN